MRVAMRVRWCGLTLALVLALAACGAQASSSNSPGSSSGKYLSVPTHQTAPGIAMSALLTGRMAGRADTERKQACFWIAESSGRFILLWPPGYVAENDPLRVLNQSRRVVGQVGQEMSLGGGGAPVTQATPGVQPCGSPAPTNGWVVASSTAGG